MINKLYYAPLSLQDLDDIQDYITLELCNPDAALKTVMDIINKIDSLKIFPQMGTSLTSTIGLKNNYRYLYSDNYIIFYRFIECSVYIDRILHNHRDYLHTLFTNSQINF